MRRLLGLALLFGALVVPGVATSQSYPLRPIVMVVPFAAGGGTDVIARIIADAMSDTLGQRIVVENAPGAGGTTGSDRVKRATPDGYTILTGHMGTHSSSFSLYRRPPYDPRTDFEPIGIAASAPIVLFTRPGFPTETLEAFIRHLRSEGDRISVGHSGVGSNAHLTCALLMHIIQARPSEVAYRGNAPLMTDLTGDRLDFSCDQAFTLGPYFTSGRIRALAITGTARSPAMPTVPTFAEAGLAAYDVEAWTAMFAPAGTPEPVLERLNAAYQAALERPAVVDRLTQLGARVPPHEHRSRAYLATLVRNEVERWGEVVRSAGIPQQE